MCGTKSYFFCGIGGSGMLPLALILKARGFAVSGSDRSLDQGRTPEKFAFLRASGIDLFAQDGSGIISPQTIVVTSAAVERTVPDVAAAIRIGAMMLTRAELLSKLFNEAPLSVGIAGTSGKSTVTGMTGWLLYAAGMTPTVMNGAVMKNFVTPHMPYANALPGGPTFVSEIDESDGSIARYIPTVAVLNNVAHDHKSMEELRTLFGGFLTRSIHAVVNLDNAEAAELASHLPASRALGFGIENDAAQLVAADLVPAPGGIAFHLHVRGTSAPIPVMLQVPGRHNVSNALAAIGAAMQCGIAPEVAAKAIGDFTGIRRRMETVGQAGGITVIDDFAHNPDKISATLEALHEFSGRLLILFQPQGYGPLRLLKDEFIAVFRDRLGPDDVVVFSDPVYFGGTTDTSVSSNMIVDGIAAGGRNALYFPAREDGGGKLLEMARTGDRIVVMGARDDTLSEFAAQMLEGLR